MCSFWWWTGTAVRTSWLAERRLFETPCHGVSNNLGAWEVNERNENTWLGAAYIRILEMLRSGQCSLDTRFSEYYTFIIFFCTLSFLSVSTAYQGSGADWTASTKIISWSTLEHSSRQTSRCACCRPNNCVHFDDELPFGPDSSRNADCFKLHAMVFQTIWERER